MIWVISDTHFGHENLRKYTGRPENIDDIFLENIAAANYQEGDILVHLGDFCLSSGAKCKEFHARFLNALPVGVHSILVRGNHDTNSLSWYLKRGWDMVADRWEVEFLGKKILFSHKPQSLRKYDFDVNIHGHFHNSLPDHWEPEFIFALTDRHILFDPEHLYKPLKIKEVLTRKDMRTIVRLDQWRSANV